MRVDWLSSYPEKKKLISSLDLNKLLVNDMLPLFKIEEKQSKKLAGVYHIDKHLVTIQPLIVKPYTSERFLNLLLHEIGHSTAKYTNRWERLISNCPSRGFDEAIKLEEQIAEILGVILTLSLVDSSKVVNLREFNKYIITNSNRYSIPWEEVTIALGSVVHSSKFNVCLKWSNVLHKYITHNNIALIKKGVFNGER
jgi:hypothetical protein